MPGPARTYPSNAARQQAYRQRCRTVAAGAADAGGPVFPRLPTAPGPARWRMLREQAQTLLSTAAREMEAYYEARSATWRDGERGEALLEQLEALQEALQAVDELAG